MNSNCLILLTNYYPFRKGEEYLEYEIDYLSMAFSKVYIIATMVDKSETQTRQIPSNVEAYPLGVDLSTQGKIRLLLKDRKKVRYIREEKSRPSEYSNFLHKIYTQYFESRCQDAFRKTRILLDRVDFSEYSQIAIYSYWLYVTADLAINIKNQFFKGREVYTFSRAHRYDIDVEASPLKYLPYRPYFLEHLDNVFPVSSKQVIYLEDTYPQWSDKVEQKRLGVRSAIKSIDSRCNALVEPIIVSVSTTNKVKRLPLIIEGLSSFRKKNPDFKFQWVHFGSGKDIDSIEKNARMKIGESYVDFKGYVPNENLREWYKEHRPRAFINLSSSEGVPVSIMEACAFAIPVIATDVGGNPDIVRNNVNGFLLPSNPNNGQVEEAIHEMFFMDVEAYENMSRLAYEMWDKYFNLDIEYSEFVRDIITRL